MTIKELQKLLITNEIIRQNISENEILLLLKRLPSNPTGDDLWSALRDLNLKSESLIKSCNDDILKMILDFKKENGY